MGNFEKGVDKKFKDKEDAKKYVANVKGAGGRLSQAAQLRKKASK